MILSASISIPRMDYVGTSVRLVRATAFLKIQARITMVDHELPGMPPEQVC
jgi:hypothetical protein